MRYALGTALIVAVLVGGAVPALAGAQVTATCDRWDVTLSDYKAGSTVSIWLDGVLAIDEYVFQDGFSLGGAWQKYADTHLLGVRIDLNGVLQHDLNHGATGCPTSAPPTTAPAPPTTAPAPPTTAPAPPYDCTSYYATYACYHGCRDARNDHGCSHIVDNDNAGNHGAGTVNNRRR